MKTFDFWFDYSSPYAYLASTQVEAVAARTGATVVWRPMLLGGLFKAIGQVDAPLATFGAAKARHVSQDLRRWADVYGVPFVWPSRFPMRTIAALRATLVLEGEDRVRWIHRVFRAYWAEDNDIASATTLAGLLAELGLPAYVLDATNTEACKQSLVAATAEAERSQVFGAPTFVVDGQLFWGQDRLPLVERALATGWKVD